MACSARFGDDVEVLAALQFLPRLDVVLDGASFQRRAAALPHRVTVFTTGLAARIKAGALVEWPPAPLIDPVIVSLPADDAFMTFDALQHLRAQAQFAVEDTAAQAAFADKGLRPLIAHMLLTLGGPANAARAQRNGIMLAGLPPGVASIVPDALRVAAKRVSMGAKGVDSSLLMRLDQRQAALWQLSHASLVLTGSMDVVLVCAAAKTPVVLFAAEKDAHAYLVHDYSALSRYVSVIHSDADGGWTAAATFLERLDVNAPRVLNQDSEDFALLRIRLERLIARWPQLEDAALISGVWQPREGGAG